MHEHEKAARRILRNMGFEEGDPETRLSPLGTQVLFRWDGVGITKDGASVVVEVEPANPNEGHVRLHVTNLALQVHFQQGVNKLVWVVNSESPSCHVQLKSYAECWAGLLSKALGHSLPPMEYRDIDGRTLVA